MFLFIFGYIRGRNIATSSGGMTRVSEGYRGDPQRSKAGTRIVLFTVAGLLACVVGLGVAAGRSLSEESAACNQYGCVDEPASIESLPTGEPGTPHSGSASPSVSASASSSASAATVETSGVAEVDAPTAVATGASASASASASAGSEEELPADGSAPAASVLPGDATDMDESDTPDAYAQPSSEEPLSSTRPVKGYPYDGKPCEDRYCGIEGVNVLVECARYETAAGEKVYGCANPDAFKRRECYEITFYTSDGAPYNNMDTCSGEKEYAPPEPPEGVFQYWEPPDKTQWLPNLYGHSVDHCDFGLQGQLGVHCGLDRIPENYECAIYYDTAYGTVRGCADGDDLNDYYSERPMACAERLHLYDEAGREIDTLNSCPKVRMEDCKTAQCGKSVPRDWSCRKEHWNFGQLYGEERRTLIRCADPLLESLLNSEVPFRECKGGLLGVLYDERGRELDAIACGSDGSGGNMAEWAGFDADAADDALDDDGTVGEPGGKHENVRPGAAGSDSDSRGDTQASSEDASEIPSAASGQQEERPVLATLYGLLTGSSGVAPDTAVPPGASDGGSTITSVWDFTAEALPSSIAGDEAEGGETGVQAQENANARVETKVQDNVADEEVAAAKWAVERFDQPGGQSGTTRSDGVALSAKGTDPESGREDELRSTLMVGTAEDVAAPSSGSEPRATAGDERGASGRADEASGTRSTAVGWGETLGRARAAAVQSVRDIGGFAWTKAVVALAVIGGSGGAVVVRRRLPR